MGYRFTGRDLCGRVVDLPAGAAAAGEIPENFPPDPCDVASFVGARSFAPQSQFSARIKRKSASPRHPDEDPNGFTDVGSFGGGLRAVFSEGIKGSTRDL